MLALITSKSRILHLNIDFSVSREEHMEVNTELIIIN